MRIHTARLTWVHACLYTILMPVLLHAQDDAPSFVRYTVREGLSDNYITGIAQDSFGFIWIGTDNGLNRFDGYAFEHNYSFPPLAALISPAIRSLKILPDGHLGVMTKRGFQQVNVLSLHFREFLVPDTTPFVSLLNSVWDVEWLGGGRMAMTTAAGFYVFDADGALQFRHDAYTLADRRDKRILYGREIFTLPGGHILAYVEPRELAHFDSGRNTYEYVMPGNREWAAFCHPEPEDGGYWSTKAQISADEFVFIHPVRGAVYYHYSAGRRVFSAIRQDILHEFTWESSFELINDSTLAISSGYSGFYFLHLDRRSGAIRLQPEKHLPEYKVNTIFRDRNDRLWVGTPEGLFKQRLQRPLVSIHTWPSAEPGLQGYSAAYAHQDKLYLGRIGLDTSLWVLDAASLEVTDRITFPFGNPEVHQPLSLQMYHPDTLWIATGAGMLWLDTRNGHTGRTRDLGLPAELDEMNYLAPPHPDGSAWMLRILHGKVIRYDPVSRTIRQWDACSSEPLPFQQIKHIAYDAYGDVWFAGHGLVRWSRTTGQFASPMTVYAGPNAFGDDILTLAADQSGSLWLHNAENGLLRYRIRERQFDHLGLAEGLPSMILSSFSPVIGRTLLIATPHHLISLDTESLRVQILADEWVLPETPPYARHMYYDATRDQVYGFYPGSVIRFPAHPAPARHSMSRLIVKQVVANQARVLTLTGQPLSLRTNERNLSVLFSLIDFEFGASHRFAYRLSPSEEWIPIGTQRFLHLTNLHPGTYTLGLRATGRDPNPYFAEINFIIRAPFWRQIWFYVLAGLVAAGIAYLLMRLHMGRIRAKAEMDAQIAQAEMKALHAQMNPHFVFNSLNSIKQMILQRELGDASRYLSDFAQLIRMTLHQSRKPFISLRETMDYLKRYVAMEKIRNPDFTFDMYADPSLDPDETILPPMLIQPFIENAIWHGPGIEGRIIHIRVRFQSRDDHLVCLVEDDGVGLPPAQGGTHDQHGHESVGISNIRQRIELLNRKHNLRSSLHITDSRTANPNGKPGTRVCITLPLEITES